MGHYDFCYSFDESYKIELTKEMVERLEKHVLQSGGMIIVYDDVSGVTNIRLAERSKKLDYTSTSGSSWKIYLKKYKKN